MERGAPARAGARRRSARREGRVETVERPAPQDHLQRLRVRHRLPRAPRARVHALRPARDRARQAEAPAGHLPELPRQQRRGVPEGRAGERRPGVDRGPAPLRARAGPALRRLGEGQPDDLRRGDPARVAPGDVPGLPRPQDDGPARDAPGVHRGDRGPGPVGRAGGPPAEHREVAQGRPQTRVQPQRTGQPPGDADHGLRPVPRRVPLQGRPEASHVPVEERPEGRADGGVLRRDRVHRLDAQGLGGAGDQGPTPGVRALEPGDPRALRGVVRRLPHALQARRGDEVHRPPGAVADGAREPVVPGVPQLQRDRDRLPRRPDPGEDQGDARPGGDRAGRTDRVDQGRRRRGRDRRAAAPGADAAAQGAVAGGPDQRRELDGLPRPGRSAQDPQ